MRLFEYLDQALLRAERHSPRTNREAYIWPSSASATLYNQTEARVVGKCQRAEVFRMIGEEPTNPVGEISARRFRMGRSCEKDVVQLAKDAGIFVCSGVRAYIEDINMTLELDLVVLDPETGQAVIVENKSIYGWYGNKEVIRDGKPKKEAVLQELVYLNEFRDGERLREMVLKGLEKKAKDAARVKSWKEKLEAEEASFKQWPEEIERCQRALGRALYDWERNRIEVDEGNLAKMDAGPLAGKLAYESRDECQTREFDIGIWRDPGTGKHVPQIDGEPYHWFDLEDVYARWRSLKTCFQTMQAEAQRRLAARGIALPEDDGEGESAAAKAYWDMLGTEMRGLPKEFLPPADYDWKYTDQQIEAMRVAGVLSKTKYNKWKRRAKGFERLGAWNCAYCAYKARCVPLEYPELAYLALEELKEEEEEEDAA